MRSLPLLAVFALGASVFVRCALGDDSESYPDSFRVESAIGEVPGHWSLTKQGFRNEYLPDSGFGGGIFSVPLRASTVIAFELDSVTCLPCTRLQHREHRLRNDSRPRNAYECLPSVEDRRIFVMPTNEPVPNGFDPGWVESGDKTPRFPISRTSRQPVRFHEWITTKEVLPGKRLACGAWFEGAYPPERGYNELRGDTTDIPYYVIHDRAIYLVGSEGRPEFLFSSKEEREAWKSTYECAFLPSDYSELERVRFSYVYPVQGGFWLRIALLRDFEGAGVDEGVYLLEFRNGRYTLLAGACETRMY